MKNTSDAAEPIKKISKEIIRNEEYTLVLLAEVSLFTNVPLRKNVNITLDRVYNQKLIKTTLSKKVLKKLILDTSPKTTFTFNNIIYEQKDGVSMGSLLGPVLANIIMTECEKAIVDNLVKEGAIKFYVRYVDDTLYLVKRQDDDKVLKAFNEFGKKLSLPLINSRTKHHITWI